MRRASGHNSFKLAWTVAEFRALWAADLFSIAGDQLARVALAVLVFDRTGSAALTGLTYALTFVPMLAGGVLLGGLGDRFPCREVMVVADLVRAVLMALMAVPELPLWLLCVLVGATTFTAGPFKAAQQSLLPDLLPTEPALAAGQAIRSITNQSAQVLGFAGGGALVAAINPSFGLALNACTFLVSAVIVRWGLRHRPASAGSAPGGLVAYVGMIVGSSRFVWRNRRLRVSLLLSWLAGFQIAHEALAAPYAVSVGYATGAVGLLMASDPAGSAVGAFVFQRWVPPNERERMVGVLAVVAGVPLVVCLLRPSLVVSVVVFAVVGALATAVVNQTTVSFARDVPPSRRAQGTGLLSSGLIASQGLGALVAGPIADWLGPATSLALIGLVGAGAAIPVAVQWRRLARSQANLAEDVPADEDC